MNWHDDRRITSSQPPILNVVSIIAEELCPTIFGCYYREIDVLTDKQKLHDLFRKANIVRYMRAGINPTAWITKEEASGLLPFVPEL
jgi:hypothetical protein